jgi:hypothetical protein
MSIAHAQKIGCALSLAACGGHTLDVGSTGGGPAPGDLAQDGGTDAPAGPLWNGYLENAQLSDGSNRLTMTLSLADDGIATGTLLLGDGSLLRPATDPNLGYPPGVQFPVPAGPLGFFEGFAYTILDGRLSGSTLTFRVAEFDLWTRWCLLQTTTYSGWSSDDGGPTYSCAPNWGWSRDGTTGCVLTDPATMSQLPMDCGKIELCQNSPCNCSATGCRVNPSNQPDLAFDLAILGANADGTISGLLGEHNVHFVRAP